jgi:LDH2 family malate/lactate/ureidoglycolate dehydrogenase
MAHVTIPALEAFIGSAFEAVGLTADDASIAAAALARTEARGIHTHGIRQVPRYIRAIQAGGVNARAQFDIVRETPGTAVVDGDAGLGHVVATRAMRLAMAKATQTGAAAVLARNSTHLGALSVYALMAAEADMVASVYTTTPRAMQAAGGRSASVGTGPVAHAVPGNRAPFVLDIAMSVVSGNRVTMTRERGEQVPLGWIVGPDGLPSTNPADHRNGGALVAIAGYKGYGMALFTELLAGALSGLDWDSGDRFKTHQPGSAYFADLGPSDRWNAGHAFIVLDVKAFVDPAELRDRVDRLADLQRHTPSLDETDPVRVPGDRAHAAEQEARRSGLELSAGTASALAALAAELSIPTLEVLE